MTSAPEGLRDEFADRGRGWRAELAQIDRVMRTVSTLSDPQEVVNFYGTRWTGSSRATSSWR